MERLGLSDEMDDDSMAPYDHGATATYSCNKGFYFNGVSTRSCGDGTGTIIVWDRGVALRLAGRVGSVCWSDDDVCNVNVSIVNPCQSCEVHSLTEQSDSSRTVGANQTDSSLNSQGD